MGWLTDQFYALSSSPVCNCNCAVASPLTAQEDGKVPDLRPQRTRKRPAQLLDSDDSLDLEQLPVPKSSKRAASRQKAMQEDSLAPQVLTSCAIHDQIQVAKANFSAFLRICHVTTYYV